MAMSQSKPEVAPEELASIVQRDSISGAERFRALQSLWQGHYATIQRCGAAIGANGGRSAPKSYRESYEEAIARAEETLTELGSNLRRLLGASKMEDPGIQRCTGQLWVHLADLHRFRISQAETVEEKNRSLQLAERLYWQAVVTFPQNGQAFTQLGLLAAARGDKLAGIHCYFRAMLCAYPYGMDRLKAGLSELARLAPPPHRPGDFRAKDLCEKQFCQLHLLLCEAGQGPGVIAELIESTATAFTNCLRLAGQALPEEGAQDGRGRSRGASRGRHYANSRGRSGGESLERITGNAGRSCARSPSQGASRLTHATFPEWVVLWSRQLLLITASAVLQAVSQVEDEPPPALSLVPRLLEFAHLVVRERLLRSTAALGAWRLLRRLGAALVQVAEGSDGTLWSSLALFTTLCRPLPVWMDDGEMGALRGRLWRFIESIDVSKVRGLDRGASLQIQLPEDDELHGLTALPLQFPPALFAPAQVFGPVVAAVQAPTHDHEAARLARLAVYVGKPPGGNLTLLHVAGVKPVPPSGPTTTEAWPHQQWATRGPSPPPRPPQGQKLPQNSPQGAAAGPCSQRPGASHTLAEWRKRQQEVASGEVSKTSVAQVVTVTAHAPGAPTASTDDKAYHLAGHVQDSTESSSSSCMQQQPTASQPSPPQQPPTSAAAANSQAGQAKQEPLLPPHLRAATWRRRPTEVTTDTRNGRNRPLAAFFPQGDLMKASTTSQRGRAATKAASAPTTNNGSSTWLDLCIKAQREDRGEVVTKSTTKSTDPVPDVNLESAFPKLAANAKASDQSLAKPPVRGRSDTMEPSDTPPVRGRTETMEPARRAVSEQPKPSQPVETRCEDTAWPALVPSTRLDRGLPPRRFAPQMSTSQGVIQPASALRSQSEHDKAPATSTAIVQESSTRSKRPVSLFSGRANGPIAKDARPRHPSLEISQPPASQHGSNRRAARRKVAMPQQDSAGEASAREPYETSRSKLVEVEPGFDFAADMELRREASLAASDRGDDRVEEECATEGEPTETGTQDAIDAEEEFGALKSIFGDDFCRPWERTFEVVLQSSGKNAASRKKPWRLRGTLPPGYPSDPPVLELVGDAPNEIRSTIQQLPQTQGWSGGCFGIINAAKELASQLAEYINAAPTSANGADAEAAGTIQMERAFFCFTNAPSRSSGGLSAHDVEVICDIVRQHPTMGGVVTQGKPGVLILEGIKAEVEDTLAEVKRHHAKMRRGKPEMIERLIERKAILPEQVAEWRAFEQTKFQALDADFNKPRSKQGWLNKGTLKEELEVHGLGDRFNLLFGI